MLLPLLVIAITSCTEDEDNFCEVTVVSGEGGTATIYPYNSTHKIVLGWWVKVTATPEKNYRFVNWTVNGKEVSRDNPYKATPYTSTQFKANFEKDNFSVKVLSSEGGKAKASQEGEVLNGTKVTFTATSQEDYGFVNWTVNGKEVSTKNPYTVTITEDLEIKANFITHKITVRSSEGGTAVADKTQVGNNEKVTFTATPNEGYSFVNWTVNGREVSTENPYTATITDGISIKANFKALHKVSVIASEGGSAKASHAGEVLNGTEVSFTATANEGYRFVNWTVNGVVVSNEPSYTVAITDDKEYHANFEELKDGYTVNLNNQWRKSSNISNPNPRQYDGVYESHSNYNVNSSTSSMIIEIYGYTEFTLYVRSDGENNYDYVTVSGLDNPNNIKYTAKGKSNSGISISSYTPVTFSGIDGGLHTITIEYSKDVSQHSGTDRGYILIPKLGYVSTPEMGDNTENGHEYVDLGLSVKWATCNVGADTPEGYGDYFAWGETEPKTTYNWSTYKYCNGSYDTMTKYCTESGYGTVDNKTTLELSDDAANVNLGGNWRMPTMAEQDELRNTSNCSWTWTSQNGVNGYIVTSKKNGNSIFLPAAGDFIEDSLCFTSSYGYYWSSSLSTLYSYYAYDLRIDSREVDWGYHYGRYRGRPIRPVCP